MIDDAATSHAAATGPICLRSVTDPAQARRNGDGPACNLLASNALAFGFRIAESILRRSILLSGVDGATAGSAVNGLPDGIRVQSRTAPFG